MLALARKRSDRERKGPYPFFFRPTDIGSSSVKTVADRHRHAAYLKRLFKGRTSMTLNGLEHQKIVALSVFCDFRLRCTLQGKLRG